MQQACKLRHLEQDAKKDADDHNRKEGHEYFV